MRESYGFTKITKLRLNETVEYCLNEILGKFIKKSKLKKVKDLIVNEIVAFDLKEVRERDWENGMWRARMADKWQLFR